MDPKCCSRRDVLESVGCLGLTLAAFGLSSKDARALPVFFFEADQAGSERRYPIPAADSVTIDRTASVIVVRFSNRTPRRSSSCRIVWLSAEGVTPICDAAARKLRCRRRQRTRSDRQDQRGALLNSSQHPMQQISHLIWAAGPHIED